MKVTLRLLAVACFALSFLFASVSLSQAQTPTPTPTPAPTPTSPSIADPVITQISSSSGESFVGDISGNGRFVVIESTGNIATVNPRNADLNREIFLFDYAQRQIFQITDTQSALRIPGATPTPTPTPSPSPSPTPTPGVDPATIDVEVSNNRPVISNDGRYIVFTSNATNPASFDGNTDANRTALRADGNQEIFLYLIPGRCQRESVERHERLLRQSRRRQFYARHRHACKPLAATRHRDSFALRRRRQSLSFVKRRRIDHRLHFDAQSARRNEHRSNSQPGSFRVQSLDECVRAIDEHAGDVRLQRKSFSVRRWSDSRVYLEC